MPETKNRLIKKNLVVLIGPTAVGKTKIAIKLAKYFQTEIISADSRQFYKELKIGTAIPTENELASVPHHFIRHLSILDYYNVSKFENDTLKLLEDLFGKLSVVIMAGGSGLYVDAVCKGIDVLPDPDIKIRNEIKELYKKSGIEALCKKLQQLDPQYFEQVDKNNPNRIMRGIEVCLSTGKTFTSLRKNIPKKRDFRIIKIGLNKDRKELFENICKRTDQMIADGLVNEVKNLRKFLDKNALNTVGYKEISYYLDGKVTLEQAVENIKTNTRRYAKRQLTWFKRDNEIKWFAPDEPDEIIFYIETKINEK